MREILFRGKRKDTGEWVEGDFVRLKDGSKAIPHIYGYGEVIPETVGQFTGLTDKNGKKIFEGDIVTISSCCANMTGIVEFHDCGFEIREGDTYECLWYEPDELEVIGNIHDNPELLGGVEDGN